MSDLPWLGALFGKTAKSAIRRELVVLITPKVIYNHQNAVQITHEYADKLNNLKHSLERE